MLLFRCPKISAKNSFDNMLGNSPIPSPV